MKYCVLLLVALVLGSCAGTDKTLTVKQFYLRDQEDDEHTDPMVRGEKNRILYGAVSMAERKDRLGQYYTILWNDAAGVGQGEVEVLFEFQQGKTASKIKKRSQTFPSSDASGKAVFSVIGDDFYKSGKVLAWRATISRGGKTLAQERSYLWK